MELTAVITSKAGVYAVERAERAGVPVYLVERELFPNQATFCNALLNKLRDLDVELVVCAGFTETLSYGLLHYYKNRVINVQPALFPAFCGADGFNAMTALEQTIKLGLRYTGATAYFMTEDDTGCGPIILQKAVPVENGDTPETLQRRIMEQAEWKILPEAVSLFCEGRLEVNGAVVTILPPKA